MKKTAITFLLLLYLTPTFGVNVTVHYCGGEISSIFFGKTSDNKCACGVKKMKKNCCEDKNSSCQVNDDHAKPQQFSISPSKTFDIQAIQPLIFQLTNVFFPLITPDDYFHHPPDNKKQPLYILNQVFLI